MCRKGELVEAFFFLQGDEFPADIKEHFLAALAEKIGPERIKDLPEGYPVQLELFAALGKEDWQWIKGNAWSIYQIAFEKHVHAPIDKFLEIMKNTPDPTLRTQIIQAWGLNPKADPQAIKILITSTHPSQMVALLEQIGKQRYWVLNRAAKLLTESGVGLPFALIAIRSSIDPAKERGNVAKMKGLARNDHDLIPKICDVNDGVDEALSYFRLLEGKKPDSPSETVLYFHLMMTGVVNTQSIEIRFCSNHPLRSSEDVKSGGARKSRTRLRLCLPYFSKRSLGNSSRLSEKKGAPNSCESLCKRAK